MKKVSLSSTKSVMHLIYQVISSAIVFIIYFVWDLEGRLSWEYIDCFEFQLISNSSGFSISFGVDGLYIKAGGRRSKFHKGVLGHAPTPPPQKNL